MTNQPAPITVQRIEAANFLRFASFELEPEKLTLLRGRNDQGKTSVLRMIQLCVQGSSHPEKVVKDGASKGLVALTLSNGYKLRRSFTAAGNEYFDVIDERGHKVPSPQAFVDKWLGEYRDFNPLSWLAMSAKDQVRVLLQAVSVTLTPAEFAAVTGRVAPSSVDFTQHGLIVLDDLRAHFAEDRKIENRLADQKKKAAQEARASLPAVKPVITAEHREEAQSVAAKAASVRASLEARTLAATSHVAAVDRLNLAKSREISEQSRITDEINRKRLEIARLEEEHVASVSRMVVYDEELSTLATTAPPSDSEKEEANVLIRKANALALSIKEAEKELARFVEAERIEQEAIDAAAEASIIDDTIKEIDTTLRQSLMAKAQLPVGNLTIEEGRILVDGHELEYLAESQRMRIAVAIARALQPTLRMIVLDGTEAIDNTTFAAFLEEIHGDGFCYIATRVDPNGNALEIVQFGETEAGVVETPRQEVA
jgi:hypothetical protein